MLITFLTLVLMVSLGALDRPLKTDEAPLGIVSFELAKTVSRAQSILGSWDSRARVYAGLSLGIDYLFLVAYSLSISLACALIAGIEKNRLTLLAAVGAVLGWGQLAAAMFDAVENYALIQVLLGSGLERWPAIAWWCALPKFAIVAAGLMYVLLAGGISAGRVVLKGRSSQEGAV